MADARTHKGSRWVTVWAAMPQLTEEENLPPPPFWKPPQPAFSDTTVRQTLRVSTGGPRLRLRISNAFGLADLRIAAVSIALPQPAPGCPLAGSRRVLQDTLQAVTFGGQRRSVLVPTGGLALSDAVVFPVAAAQIVTISIYLDHGQEGGDITSHPGSRTQSWLSRGNHTDCEDMTGESITSVFHWYFLSAVEIWQPHNHCALALVGDSITDGRCSTDNGNDRWPDRLFDRMQHMAATQHVAVFNVAAGGNRVLTPLKGPNVISRLDRDVLAQSGVRYMLVFAGVNDIGTAEPDVDSQTAVCQRLVWAFEQIVERAHAVGIIAWGATITPFGAPAGADQAYASPAREVARQAVNRWIRTSGVFNAVVDFDAVLRDPCLPSRLLPDYNSGDFLHPNVKAFEALAKAFPLELFTHGTEGE